MSDVVVHGPVPKHAQLRAILEQRIDQEWAPDTAIPSERDLLTEFGLSRATVREALRQLVDEGRLYKVHGKGTFVAGPRFSSHLHLASFTDDMRRRGLVAATILRGVNLVEPPVEARAALGLPAGEKTWLLERLRLAGGVAMALERGYYPEHLLPGLDGHDLTASLYSTLVRSYGIGIDSAEQTVWAEAAEPEVAETMGITTASPVMVFRRTSRAAGVAVEYVTSWYRGDRYQVHMSLQA